MSKRYIKQRQVYFCDLYDTKDSETSDSHPVIVVSVDIRNNNSPNVYVFPITHSTTKKYQPTHWRLYKEKYDFFIHEVNTVLCEDGRSISKNRLNRYLGEIDEEDLKEILRCKEYIFKIKD